MVTRAVDAGKRPVLIVSFQGALGWKKDANLSMDDLLNSKKNFGRKSVFLLVPPEGRMFQSNCWPISSGAIHLRMY